ncbi:glutathione S-transferase N-terminal domain-containing protein [Bradyrhizobium sp. NP1]|uniref:glutathione S-transferase N-terminal domain-containing protein n=1 Tax=Bradyrhizobium sp. NP1 TaxID=3049772 RepID=UPI0025A61595|nr:glutathione S-transferase N-terminal domain-containing protein [Bradyrhizobium sp. NP1]WJR78212.1 glutathione S-transferase N-terminal domain-containing protein [Bradyrhizobium sp. NP1]
MLDLYYWPTPNGCKITILLHELGVPYRLIPLNIATGEQFKPEFAAVSPNRRMPALVDHAPSGGGAPLSIFESGAIMMYLAEKHQRFWPLEPRARYDVAQWLMWQMAGLGPMCGQAHHFRQYVDTPVPYAAERYTKEVNRLYGVLDARLADRTFIAGDYSIADMACWPWIKPYRLQGQDLDAFENLKRWFLMLNERLAVREGWRVGRDWLGGGPVVTEQSKAILFGQTAVR